MLPSCVDEPLSGFLWRLAAAFLLVHIFYLALSTINLVL